MMRRRCSLCGSLRFMVRQKLKMVNIEETEKEFHDEWAKNIQPKEVPVIETFSVSTSPEAQWILKQLKDIEGKQLLELGCGAGEGAVYFAIKGAKVVATDLSPKMLNVVHEVASLHGTSLETKVCSAEDLSIFPSDSFDIVYAANLLHHVNIEKCLDEVKRVLRPGGMAAFWDPVAHNPIINVYRKMAQKVRTSDEHPIRRSQMVMFKNRFSQVKTRFFWLSTLIIFMKFYLIDRIHPSSDRYWKRILLQEKELRKLYRPLAFIDRILLKIIPVLGWLSWNIAIVVTKEDWDNEVF